MIFRFSCNNEFVASSAVGIILEHMRSQGHKDPPIFQKDIPKIKHSKNPKS